MAYNPYFPQGYQPQYNSYYPQQLMQAQPQIQQAPQPSGIIWVSGLQEAQAYPVAPNNAVALWEQSGKIIYLKQTDATGKPNLKAFDLVERTQGTQGAFANQDEQSPAYATKEELDKLLRDVEKIKKQLKEEADDDT